jgi:hypothetical protein
MGLSLKHVPTLLSEHQKLETSVCQVDRLSLWGLLTAILLHFLRIRDTLGIREQKANSRKHPYSEKPLSQTTLLLPRYQLLPCLLFYANAGGILCSTRSLVSEEGNGRDSEIASRGAIPGNLKVISTCEGSCCQTLGLSRSMPMSLWR